MKVPAITLLFVLVAARAHAEEAPTIDLAGCPLFDADSARRAIRAELAVPAAGAPAHELRIVVTCPDADGALVEIRSSPAPLREHITFGDLVGAQRLRLVALVIAELVGSQTSREAPPPPDRRVPRAALVSELGVGIVAGWSGAAVTGGGSIELSVGPAASRWAAHVSLLGLSREDQALPPGSVTWTRPRGAVGARYRLAHDQHVSVDLRADAIAAVLVVSGDGFTANETAFAFDPGLSGGARVAVGWHRWTWFLDASAVGWLREQRAAVVGLEDYLDLPRAEALLQVGLTVSLGQGH